MLEVHGCAKIGDGGYGEPSRKLDRSSQRRIWFLFETSRA